MDLAIYRRECWISLFAETGRTHGEGTHPSRERVQREYPIYMNTDNEEEAVDDTEEGPGTDATLDADQGRGSETAASPVAGPCVTDHSLSAKRKAEHRELREYRKRGAILAPDRKSEGYALPAGKQQTCLVDAAYNAVKTLSSRDMSLAKLRSLAVPELGNVLQASWASTKKAMASLDLPFDLQEATAQFQNAKGGPMLNLVRAPPAVYVVALHVTIDSKSSNHAIMMSTIPEEHAPFGKMVDNHGKMKPVYLEAADKHSKNAAKKAFRKLVGQNPAVCGRDDFGVKPADIYQLVQRARCEAIRD